MYESFTQKKQDKICNCQTQKTKEKKLANYAPKLKNQNMQKTKKKRCPNFVSATIGYDFGCSMKIAIGQKD